MVRGFLLTDALSNVGSIEPGSTRPGLSVFGDPQGEFDHPAPFPCIAKWLTPLRGSLGAAAIGLRPPERGAIRVRSGCNPNVVEPCMPPSEDR